MGPSTCLELATASLRVTTARALALLADQTNQTPDKTGVSPRKVKTRAQYLGVVSEEDLFLRNVFSKQEVRGDREVVPGGGRVRRLSPETRESGSRVIRVKVGTIKGGRERSK